MHIFVFIYYVTVSPPVVSKSHVFIALCEKLYLLGKGGPSYFYRISIMTRNNIFIHKILLHTGQYRYRCTYRSISVSHTGHTDTRACIITGIHTGPYRYRCTYIPVHIGIKLYTDPYRYQVTYRSISVSSYF